MFISCSTNGAFLRRKPFLEGFRSLGHVSEKSLLPKPWPVLPLAGHLPPPHFTCVLSSPGNHIAAFLTPVSLLMQHSSCSPEQRLLCPSFPPSQTLRPPSQSCPPRLGVPEDGLSQPFLEMPASQELVCALPSPVEPSWRVQSGASNCLLRVAAVRHKAWLAESNLYLCHCLPSASLEEMQIAACCCATFCTPLDPPNGSILKRL